MINYRIIAALAVVAALYDYSPVLAQNMPDNEQTWRERYAERRDIREERQQLRREHDELESEHDRLRIECLDARGQDHSQCQAKWHDWHGREDALMARVHALHERALADAHGQHPPCPERGGIRDIDPATGHCAEQP